MKDSLYIKSRLDALKCTMVPQQSEYAELLRAKLDILSWAYNKGEIQTKEAIQNKLDRLNEELLSMDFMHIQGLQRKLVEVKKTEINTILN